MKESETDPQLVEAFDLLMPGVGELVGGSVREIERDKLLKRMGELGIDPTEEDYRRYVEMRSMGCAPHAGFGLGFERLLLILAGGSIKDVSLFPRYYKSM